MRMRTRRRFITAFAGLGALPLLAATRVRAAETNDLVPLIDKLTVYRKLITERLFTHLAQHGLYDSARIETDRLRTIVSSFISEYAERELIPLSDDDRSKLLQAILKSMGR